MVYEKFATAMSIGNDPWEIFDGNAVGNDRGKFVTQNPSVISHGNFVTEFPSERILGKFSTENISMKFPNCGHHKFSTNPF